MLRTPRKISSSAAQSPLAGDQPPPPPPPLITNALNKTANSTTGIYQQSVYLRSRLYRLPAFAPFLQFSHSGPRAEKDVVSQLWETLSLGKPLCLLFNLQDIPQDVRIVEFADGEVDPNPLRKERQRAVALFIMGVNTLKGMGIWEKDAPLFSIGEVVGNELDTNGFVKVVATVIHLLDKLPSTVWSDDVQPMYSTVMPSQGSISSITSREDVERANLVRELIETERKYCQDLETMQSYADALRQSGIEDADTVHRLFPALGKLANFQRKLLIHIEATAEHGLDEQDWGKCFTQHESEFAIYDAYIANYSQALDLAVKEQGTLMAASTIINAVQLPAFLIKPVQRLCRYPLLLGSLLKLTPKDRPLYESLVEGVAAVKRIADMANRAIREKENEETLQNLLSRIKDWKGLALDQTGPLLLDDVFGVVGERRSYAEYHVFLFNRMILLCRPKDAQPETDSSEREQRGDWLTHGFKRSQSSTSLAIGILPAPPKPLVPSAFMSGGAVASRRAKTLFSVKGVLFVRNILELTPVLAPSHAIHIRYRDKNDVTTWTLQCRNDEQVALWNTEIKRLMDKWVEEEAELRQEVQRRPREQLPHYSSHETLDSNSLDTMRSARRPAHPYAFDDVRTKSRGRSGSINSTDSRPDYKTHGRGRSCSTSSMASDIYDTREERKRLDSNVSVSSSCQNSRHDPALVENRHVRTVSNASQASVEAQRPSSTTGTRSSLNARMRHSPLPPQPPLPSGPVPPRPDELYRFPYERPTHSRQSSAGSEASIRALPIPPPLNLRRRVGDKVPAPLVPVPTQPDDTPSGDTPQSTLPELPSKDANRPLSQRKSSRPLRGPRDRVVATPTSGLLDAPAAIRSRSHSNSGIAPGQDQFTDSTSPRSNRKLLPRRGRRGSESSSTTDSVSFVASSEEQEHDYSPLTPNSIGEEAKQSPSKSQFASSSQQFSQELVMKSRTPKSAATPVPIRGASLTSASTPRTAIHQNWDKEAIKYAGPSRSKPSESIHALQPRTPKVVSHNRINSASSLGRTSAPVDPATTVVTVRLHNEGSRFLLKLLHSTSRQEFVERIRRKIRLCSSNPPAFPEQMPSSHFTEEEHVSYLNEKNQWTRLDSDHDFSMAWNSVHCKRKDPADEGILILAVGNTEKLVY